MAGRISYSAEPEDQAAFTREFDGFYTRFAGLYDLAVKWLPVWKTWLRSTLRHIKGPRVLEVSFGTGFLLTQYADRVQAHGIDYNARMVEIAGRNLERCGLSAELCQGDVASLPYPDRSFDTVVNTMAFSGYPDGRAAMSELRRVLRPEGRLVLLDVAYPKNDNFLGTSMVRQWQKAGDVIRDLGALFDAHGFAWTDHEVGGFGSVHLFVARPAANPGEREG